MITRADFCGTTQLLSKYCIRFIWLFWVCFSSIWWGGLFSALQITVLLLVQPKKFDGTAYQTAIIITPTKEVMFSSVFDRLSGCLCVCLLATLRKNFRTDLHEIFTEGWQWVNEQMVKFRWLTGSWMWMRIRIRIPIVSHGKMCLGGGMHCSSASSCILCPSFAIHRQLLHQW